MIFVIKYEFMMIIFMIKFINNDIWSKIFYICYNFRRLCEMRVVLNKV